METVEDTLVRMALFGVLLGIAIFVLTRKKK